MRMKRIHHLVVTEGPEIVGVISDRDMGGRHGVSVRNTRRVSELMTGRVVTAEPTTPVRKAANLLRGKSIGCLVITDRGRIVGIVTAADLLELLGRGVERPIAVNERRTISHRAPHRKRHQAAGAW
jgi:CBS domain-containing protein